MNEGVLANSRFRAGCESLGAKRELFWLLKIAVDLYLCDVLKMSLKLTQTKHCEEYLFSIGRSGDATASVCHQCSEEWMSRVRISSRHAREVIV